MLRRGSTWSCALGLAAAGLIAGSCGAPESGGDGIHDLVILGGRVMDPETGLDAVRNVGVDGTSVVAVTEAALQGRDTIEAGGLVVAPGFIDLHAHGQDTVSQRLQALDGVTTALEMEIGVYPVGPWIAEMEDRALVNFGATVSHPGARTKLLTGVDAGHVPMAPPGEDNALGADAIYEPLDDAEIDSVASLMAAGLNEGGLGFGFGITYTPGASRVEIYRLFEAAARLGIPAYVHLRGDGSGGTMGAFQEVVANAAATGASLHIVHLNSSSDELAREALALIRGARSHGVDVTTEAYPYTAGSTLIESALFDSWEGQADSVYARLQWPGQADRLNSRTFRQYRDQGGWVVIHGRNEETNEWIVAQPDVMVASDGIPFRYVAVHPRGAGTYSRVLGHYVRERQALGLMEALAKMTLLPAQRLEGAAPAMARKGRVQAGSDADLTVFDPATILDRSTYERPDAPSVGVMHVLVGGVPVVRDGSLVEGAWPGRAIRGQPAEGEEG